MKIKNKGKIHPSPSSSSSSAVSSSSSSCSSHGDCFSVLKLLPAAIIALVSVLSLEDREVLAYMITRSMKTTTTNPCSLGRHSKKKSSKKQATHKPPVFDCDCFDCYTSYWFRWDSSPNRELIHQAIEAFEDHLTSGESEKSKKNNKAKRRDKSARRVDEKPTDDLCKPETAVPEVPSPIPETEDPVAVTIAVLPAGNSSPAGSPRKLGDSVEAEANEVVELAGVSPEIPSEDETLVVRTAGESSHKGLARKVLPDVLGLFNSRFLWSLWSPNL